MSVCGKSAKLGIGAVPNYVASGSSIDWDPGDVSLIESDLLEEDEATLLPGVRSNAVITFNCEKKTTDTNGQAALMTAHKNKTSVLFTFAPEGTTAGSPKITGSAYVTTPGKESHDKKSLIKRSFTLKVTGAYTEAVFP